MDTKTAKTEALELLALEELTDEQPIRLNILTALQAGYKVRVERGTLQGHTVYTLLKPDGSVYRSGAYAGMDYIWYPPPAFCTSVDACLSLPLPGEYWWLMTSHTKASPVCSAAIVLERNRQYAKTIPLAMLKAFLAHPTG